MPLAVAAGGAIGSLARYGLAVALPATPGEFPWATLLANVGGCLLIGALMAALTEAGRPHRLLRPFFGIGVLGGFTTLSTYVVEVIDAGAAGAPGVVVLYGVGTVVAALLAVAMGLILTRAALRPHIRRRKPS
ncbi:MAG: fluoride efflux transporter CrcB [Actinophytocola sp.]|nr:fluoride efflux transporter CrcB [Actinophytocola sp.]